MSEPRFHQTVIGRQTLEYTLPEMLKVFQKIEKHLAVIANQIEKEAQWERKYNPEDCE